MGTSMNRNAQGQNDLQVFTEDTNDILFSPYYQRAGQVLADQSSRVVPGGLYMMDDSGGVVSQLINNVDAGTNPIPVSGKITIGTDGFKGSASVDSGQTFAAASYKFLRSTTNVDRLSKDVVFNNGLNIINLTNIKNDGIGLIDANQFNALVVANNGDPKDLFFVYNIANHDSQLVLMHMTKPQNDGKNTTTDVNGMVYVEYNDVAYVGLVAETAMSFSDPSGIFLPGLISMGPTA